MWIWVKIGGEELLTASLSDCGADGWNLLDGFRLLFSEKAKLLNAGLLFAWGPSIKYVSIISPTSAKLQLTGHFLNPPHPVK